MRSWLLDFGPLVLAWLGVQVVLVVAVGTWAGWYAWQRRLGTAVLRLVRPERPAPLVPQGRPVEQIAADLVRVRSVFVRPGLRFAKWEGTRQAYDAVLAEAADTMRIAHLFDVLPPGGERDTERERVERLLEDAGLLRPLAA
jgi:hypothetical protein